MELENIKTQTTWSEAAESINSNNLKIITEVTKLQGSTYKNKGYFKTLSDLQSTFPTAEVGSKAYVGLSYPYTIYLWQNNAWVNSGTGGDESITMDQFYTKDETDSQISALEKETNTKLAELSEEINGKVFFQTELEYVNQSFEIFPKLEKGKTYTFVSSVPCNIEYYTSSGGYKHLFDNQTETTFVCPSDYDETKSQYVVRNSSENGTMLIKGSGLIDKQQELIEDVGALAEQTSQIAEEIDGEKTTFFSTSDTIPLQNARGFEIFQSLEKGKTYIFNAPTPCNIEYYTEDGGYQHLFDEQSVAEFICPSNYDTSKPQSVVNKSQVDCEGFSVYSLEGGVKESINVISGNLDKLSDEVREIEEGTKKKLEPNVDFEWLDGNIRDNGTIETTTSYWYTTPIKVNAGDILLIKKNYGTSINAISETDIEGSYHRPLYKNVEGVDEYQFPIERDCYVSFCHNAQVTGAGVRFEVWVISGGTESTKIAYSGFTNNAIQFQDKTTDTSFLADAKDLDYATTDRANIRKALYDREVMLYEVKNSTDEDILAQGICGYDDRSGKRIDGTITWKIYKNGILYISGYGKTYDYIKGVMEGLSKSEVEAYQQEQPTMWYYGFVKEGVQYTYSDTGFSTTYSARVYDETTGEQMDENNGMHKGYSAPFYKYRTEIDFEEYTTHEIYDSHNPLGIKYNRICFDEDLANGGITSLGDWFLYRCCVDSVVLPSQLTNLRRWAVRYSPTIRTIVMGDKVQFVEECGLSRMESMETLKISPNIERLDYSALVQNANLRHLELPKVTYIEKWGIASNANLEKLDISLLPYLRNNSLGGDKALQRVVLSNSLVGIEANNFFESAIQELVIPQDCTTILTSAFYATYRLQKVTILSNHISSTIANNQSHLFTYAKRYLIPVGNDISEYIYGILKYMGVENGYHTFIKL